jgi:SprA-related family
VLIRAPRRPLAVPSAEMRAALSRKLAEQQLQAIDAEVRAHEHAHVAALGKGVIQYDTVTGPDGIPYAVGGGVAVDLTAVPGDPEATIRKAKLAIQAAYAVGQPSGADIQVAQEAYTMEMQAQQQLDEEQAGGGVHEWYA